MATKTRNPTSDVALSGTWSGSVNSRYTLVDDYPDSVGVDYLSHGTTAGWIIFGYSAFDVPAGATNISVNVYWYDRKASTQGNNIRSRLRVGGTDYNHASSVAPVNGVWTSRVQNYATNPRSTAAWTVDDVNGIGTNGLTGVGWYSTDASPVVMLASVLIEVVYTPRNANGSATVSGIGGLSVAEVKGARGNADALLGQGTLTGSDYKGGFGSSAISCLGEVTATGEIGTETHAGIAVVDGAGDSNALGIKTASAGATDSAICGIITLGFKTARGLATGIGNGEGAVLGEKTVRITLVDSCLSEIISAGKKGLTVVILLSGTSIVDAAGYKGTSASGAISGTGIIVATGNSQESEQHSGTVIVEGLGGSSSVNVKGARDIATISGAILSETTEAKTAYSIISLFGIGTVDTTGIAEGIEHHEQAVVIGSIGLTTTGTSTARRGRATVYSIAQLAVLVVVTIQIKRHKRRAVWFDVVPKPGAAGLWKVGKRK